MNEEKDEIELNIAYIVLYGKFMKWLEPYSEGQRDKDALQVYSVLAGTQTGEGLFEAYAAGMKQGLLEASGATDQQEAEPTPAAEDKTKKTPYPIPAQPADALGELFQNLKEANGITA